MKKKEKFPLITLFRIAKNHSIGCCESKTNKNSSNKVKTSKSCCRIKNK